MSTHEHTVVVGRPVRVVYDQWTQFERYPDFMENVELVRQLDATMTHWKVRVGGVAREYDAAITQQRPDEIIQWHTVNGPDQGGMVSFDPVDNDHTRVTLRMMFEPEGITENVGEMAGLVSESVEHSLENFKDFIEHRAVETGAWRGTIERGMTRGDTVGDDSMGAGLPGLEQDTGGRGGLGAAGMGEPGMGDAGMGDAGLHSPGFASDLPDDETTA